MVVYQHIHIYMCAFIGYMSRLVERFKNEWTDLTNGPLNRYYYNNATLDIGNYMLYSIISKAARYHYLLTWFKFSYVLFWFHFLQTMLIIKSYKRSIKTYISYVSTKINIRKMIIYQDTVAKIHITITVINSKRFYLCFIFMCI